MKTIAAIAAMLLFSVARPASAFPVYSDYDAELREATARADGYTHVDTPALIARLKQLHVTTYAFLMYHSPSDFGDLSDEFLPAADQAGLEVWAYIVSPHEVTPGAEPPCQADYVCWATRLAALASQHPSLKAWVIDDFSSYLDVFTPDYMAMVRAASGSPPLPLYPIAYYPDATLGYPPDVSEFLDQDYQGLLDGITFAYEDLDSTADLQDQLGQMCELMKTRLVALSMSVPTLTASSAGDFIALSDSATVVGSGAHTLSFRWLDDYVGPTSGYQYVQLLVDQTVAYEHDVANGGAWQETTVDLAPYLTGKQTASLTFRIYDEQGISNFPVNVNIYSLVANGLDLGNGGLGTWSVSQVNASAWTATSTVRDYKGRCILMVQSENTTPQYIADALEQGEALTETCAADGLMTYALDKSPASVTFPIVANLYASWGDAGAPACAVDAGAAGAGLDAAVPMDSGQAAMPAGSMMDATTLDSTLEADEVPEVDSARETTSSCGCMTVGRHTPGRADVWCMLGGLILGLGVRLRRPSLSA